MALPTPYYDVDGITIYHGDCREILPFLPKVDLVLTDPPYGIGLSNNDVDGHRRTDDYRVTGDLDQSIGIEMLAWAETYNKAVIVFASPWKPWPGKWRNLIVWDKGGAVGGGGDVSTCLKRTWELIQVARNTTLQGGRDESVWRCAITPQDTIDHICAKPLRLMKRIINKFVLSNYTILDPFMGSGTTLVAAKQLHRKAIGIEIEEKYCEIAVKRLGQGVLPL